MIYGLDLFSGIGGLSEGLKKWVRPVMYCESDEYARHVLQSRMRDDSIPNAPIWPDVRTLTKEQIESPIDIIVAGFPCQDVSIAGLGEGLDGKRTELFFEVSRLARELRPAFIFLENVPAIRTRGAQRVGVELAEIGYDCRWDVFSAAEFGAQHIRGRWFLLAHAHSFGESERGQLLGTESPNAEPHDLGKHSVEFIPWKTEPRMGRISDGIPYAVDRTRCLGNAVVPIQAQKAFEKLIGL